MTRLARLVISLSLTITALIGGVILIGRAHTESNALETLGFGVCAGRPCFIGLAPNITKWSDITPELLRRDTIQSVSQAGPQNMSFFVNGLGIALTGQYDSPDVSLVNIGFFKNQHVSL